MVAILKKHHAHRHTQTNTHAIQTLCKHNELTDYDKLPTVHVVKLETLAYIFAADSIGLSSFEFLWWAPKDASFLRQNANRPFKVIQGR